MRFHSFGWICSFYCCLMSNSRLYHSYGDVAFCQWTAANFDPYSGTFGHWAVRVLQRAASTDTGPGFLVFTASVQRTGNQPGAGGARTHDQVSRSLPMEPPGRDGTLKRRHHKSHRSIRTRSIIFTRLVENVRSRLRDKVHVNGFLQLSSYLNNVPNWFKTFYVWFRQNMILLEYENMPTNLIFQSNALFLLQVKLIRDNKNQWSILSGSFKKYTWH